MGNPVNFELRELRMSKEHYTRILKEDELIINGKLTDDGRPRLTENDKRKINAKIDAITEKIDELLNINSG